MDEGSAPGEVVPKHPRHDRYRPSGIDWLPEVPAHWDVQPLKATVDGCINGVWGEVPEGDESDLLCVRVADFDRTSFRVSPSASTLRAVPPRTRSGRLLQPGDLLLEKSGGGDKQPVGVVVQVDDSVPLPAVCSNFIGRMPVSDGYDSRFLTYLHASLYAGRVNTRSIKQSTGIQNLDSGSYLTERVPIPPLPEQRAIADFLDRETARIDRLATGTPSADNPGLLGRVVRLLNEYRASLIFAAVTGRIAVDFKRNQFPV